MKINQNTECQQKVTKATKELLLFVSFVCFCSKTVLMGRKIRGHQSARVWAGTVAEEPFSGLLGAPQK
jgi:hypothetical protein